MIGQRLFAKIQTIFKEELEPLNLVEISRSRILHNFDLFQKLNPKTQIWPVLKSNAYGHGLVQVAQILNQRQFDYLVLDSYYEALKIKSITSRPILLIGPNHPNNLAKLDFNRITITVQDRETLKVLSDLNRTIKIHLKLNTGMNRQGIDLSEISGYLTEIKNHPKIILEGVFSHLADADNLDNLYTQNQYKNFISGLKIIKDFGFNPKFVHLSATAGAAKIKDTKINAIRLGLGLYGFNPLSQKDPYFPLLNDLQPSLRLSSTLVKIQSIKKGDKVSYNGIYTAPENMDIGVLPLGYYEGLDRRLSNRGFIKYKNKFMPIIGRICMNLSMFDLKKISKKPFDQIEVISWNTQDKNSIENMAKICHTIPYDLLVKINESIRRKIVD